jgi:hypothetical protein
MSLRTSEPSQRPTAIRQRTLFPVTSRERRLWGLVILALSLDIVTTIYGIHLGLGEGNPIARHLMELVSPLGAMVLLKGLVLALGLGAWMVLSRRYRSVVPLGLAIPWLVAGVFNAGLVLATVL